MYELKPIVRSLLLACGGMAGAALMTGPAFAQQDAQKLERVEVTGSNIKRADTETAAPVQIMTRQDIERTGKQSIQDVLRGITADGVGSIPTSFSNGFASGSAAVSLRGLGVNSTLVLVNGRRMTTYGLADDGTRNFVDLNSLPLEAVERIEILKDGASAIYGADAVGGVVNVILRKNYTGASAGASYGQAEKGDGQTYRAFGSAGFGNIDTDRYNVFFTLEAQKQKNIWSTDRGFLGDSDLSGFGYYDVTSGANRPYFLLGPSSNNAFGVTRDVDPVTGALGPRVNVRPCDNRDAATGLCRFNPRTEQEIQPEIDRINLFGRGSFQITQNIMAYTELGYFKTKTKANGTLGANNDGGVFVPGDPFNPLLVHGPMVIPAGTPNNPSGVDRQYFTLAPELGGRDQTTDNQVYRALVGLQGTALGWDYDTGLLYAKSKLKNQNFGFIVWDTMNAMVANGTYNIVSPSPEAIAAVSPVLENTPTSSVLSYDVKASRELLPLAGGPLALALGAEVRQEKADTPAVPGTDTGAIVGLGFSAFSMKRDVYALYGELNAPVTRWLELNGAVRYDHYSDFGSSTTPKIGFKVKPIDQFALRGTYAEAFRAPGPAEIGGSSFGFTTFGILSQGNPNIQPEKAKSYTLGVILEPVRELSATVDYWRVDRKNEIVQADPNAIIPANACRNACDGTGGTPNLINAQLPGAQPGTFIYYDDTGSITTVTGFYRNAAKTKTDGVDLEVRGRSKLGSFGALSAQLNWTHVRKFERTDADGNTVDYAGTHGPLVQSAGGGAPKDRATFSLTFDGGPWAATLAVNYIGPIKMIDHLNETTPQDDADGDGVPDGTITNPNTGVSYPDNGQYNCGVFDVNGNVYGNCKLPSFTTFDLFAKWTVIKNLDLNFSVQNLFDKKAPFDPYLVIPYGINYNQTWHQAGAVGRFYTIAAKYSF